MPTTTHTKTLFQEMGFSNITDFLLTAFGWYAKKWLLIGSLSLTVFLTWLASVDSWVNRAIYEPSVMLYTLAGAVVLDFLSAALPAFLKKQFEKEKALRVIPILFFHVGILTLLFHAEKANILHSDGATLFYKTLRLGFVNFAFCLYMISAVSNAGRHGYIKGKAVDYVMEYFDRNKKAVTGEKE